jgi:hypothetical protein
MRERGARTPADISESPRKWVKRGEAAPYPCSASAHIDSTIVPITLPRPCGPHSAEETPPYDVRPVWNAMVDDPEVPIADYLEHEKALQDYEGQKLNRLQIMTWAQQTRARFLRLSMADRKIFLDVLTADEGGAMAHLFAMQAQLEAKGVDDNQIKVKKAAVKALKPGGHIDDAIKPIRRALRGQQQAKQREQKMLTAGSRAALPPGRALALPGGKA